LHDGTAADPSRRSAQAARALGRHSQALGRHWQALAGAGAGFRREWVDSAGVTAADLPRRHGVAWVRATRHPFLDAVRDGSLPGPAFDIWLAQDHRFVTDLLDFQTRLAARGPRSAGAVLAAGAAALADELTWFERQAAGRHLDLAAQPLPATVAYRGLLRRLDTADAPVALTMLWALERAYLDAWSYAAPGAPVYRDYVSHWTTPQFTGYVDALETAADGALRGDEDLDAPFLEVITAETRFWEMAWENPS
jgi:thiaminase/transcriptional activator TenA